MLTVEEIEQNQQTATLEQRRVHLTLPIEERRQQLAEKAEKLLRHYENTKFEREACQGGDIFES